jgi:hypothetical protein
MKMSEYFLQRFKVKKVIFVNNERFRYISKDEMAEVRPTHIRMLEQMGDLSEKNLYFMPNNPVDLQTQIFRIHLSDK